LVVNEEEKEDHNNKKRSTTMNISHTTLLRALMAVTLLATWVYAVPRGHLPLALGFSLVIAVIWLGHAHWQRRTARKVVLDHPLPGFLRGKLREHYPQLDDTQVRQVERGLRQFFLASARADGKFVAMPSKVVDALWHEFILYTRGYEAFCQRAFGRMLHHTPADVMPPPAKRREDQRFAGLRRAWYWSCKEEGINPHKPSRLPLLFALDGLLAIPGGYHYVPDCSLLGADRGETHCATGFGCGSSCGSSCGSHSGDGGGDGGSGCGSSCGSGCGGGD